MGAGSGYTGSEKRLYQQAGEFFQSFFSGNIGFPLPQVVTAEITELGGRRFFLAVGECFCICIQSGKFFFQRIREVFWEKTEIFTVCGSLDLYGKLQLPEFYQIFEHSQVCLSGTAFKIAQPEAEELAAELSKRSTGKTVYILDEPTTGLHFADVHKLTEILRRLASDGNTVIVIEHNLDVIKTADYIIDIGPEGGDRGGTVVACGTPEEVAANEKSYTGKYIDEMLKRK